MESFLWYVCFLAIAVVGIYVFYSYFSGEMAGGAALTLLLVACVTFGFLMAVASYLGGHRKAGWTPEREVERAQVRRKEAKQRSTSTIVAGSEEGRSGYRTYKLIAVLLVVAGGVCMAFNAALGLVVIIISGLSFAGLRAVEIFEEPSDSS